MRYEDILIEPVVSEKASALREQNKYVFIVHPDATKTEIKEAVENGKQVILLMNRRGFSTYSQCKCCGTVIECPDCSIPMVWHSDGKKLKCHYT